MKLLSRSPQPLFVAILILVALSPALGEESPLSESGKAQRLYRAACGEFVTLIEVVNGYKKDGNEIYATDKLNELKATMNTLDPLFYGFNPKDEKLMFLSVDLKGFRHSLASATDHALRAIEVQASHGRGKASPYWTDLDGEIDNLWTHEEMMRKDYPSIAKWPK